jgi:lipopolysaccharide export system protein LptA
MTLAVWAIALPAAAQAAQPVQVAATAPQPSVNGGSVPIRISADNGLEWQSKLDQVVARGDAKAVRGTMSVTADSLTAHYRNRGGGNQIWRLDADGHVVITNPSDVSTGDHATYNLDTDHFVMHGTPARLVTPTNRFQARDALEYWALQHKAVLKGDAQASGKGRTLRADTLVAYFADRRPTGAAGKAHRAAGKAPRGAAAPPKMAGDDPLSAGSGADAGNMQLKMADGYGHVVLTTTEETVTGDKGHYDAQTGIVVMTGAVSITRDKNVLNGGYARVNLDTGISRLYGGPPGATTAAPTRVQGILIPRKKAAPAAGAAPQGATTTAPQGATTTVPQGATTTMPQGATTTMPRGEGGK